jgi:uncharacterized protein (DUF983 family)
MISVAGTQEKEHLMAELTYGTAASRALHLVCPRCGVGPLFKNLITMYEHCPHCSLKYERAPGYFLGSTYVNYGFMAITMTTAYMILRYVMDISNSVLIGPLTVYCVVMPIILFRYARSWWLAMDCYCDPTGFGLHHDPETNGSMEE